MSCEPLRKPGRGLLREALEEALHGPLAPYSTLKINEIGLGRRFLYVHAENNTLGISYAPQDEPLPSWLVDNVFALKDLAVYAWSHPLLTAAAVAAANAATAAMIDEKGLSAIGAVPRGDVLAVLGDIEASRVAAVGYVPGVAKTLRDRGAEVVVYENNVMHRRMAEEEGFSTSQGTQLLIDINDYDVVVATGASLIDPLVLTAARLGASRLILVGPTSSFHPLAARKIGAIAMGGSYIPPENRDKVLRLIKAGQGFRRIKKLVIKWAWRGM